MRSHLSIIVLAGVFCGLSLTGCAAYVNIPGQEGDVARHNPNTQNVIDVELTALRAALADQPIEGPFRVVLPEGSSVVTYETIVPQLGDNAVYSSDAEPHDTLPTLEIKQVNIRGTSARVDIVRPWNAAEAGGPQQLFTAYLQWEITTDWRADYTRVWRIPVDEALEESMRKSGQSPGRW